MINRYRSRISQPILDRIDLCVNVEAIEYKSLNLKTGGESSEDIRKRVEHARSIQEERYRDEPFRFNSQLTGNGIRKYCELDDECERLMEQAFTAMKLSARGYHRILRVARTIADMEGSERIESRHLAEALGYRTAVGGAEEVLR